MKRKFRVDPAFVIRIAALLCVAAFAVTVLLYGLSTGFGVGDFVRFGVQGELNVTETYTEEMDELTDLQISWLAGPVTVGFYNGAVVQLVETAQRTLHENERLSVDTSGSEMEIAWDSSLVRIPFGHSEAKALEVRIPRAFYSTLESVEISTTSGDISLDGFSLLSLSLSTVSGEIAVSNLAADAVTLSTTSGDITAENVGGLQTMAVSTVSGALALTGCDAGELSLSSTSGNMTFGGSAKSVVSSAVSAQTAFRFSALPKTAELGSVSGDISLSAEDSGEPSGFLLEFSSVSGAMDTSLPLQKEGNRYTAGNGSAEIRVTTTSGNFRLA